MTKKMSPSARFRAQLIHADALLREVHRYRELEASGEHRAKVYAALKFSKDKLREKRRKASLLLLLDISINLCFLAAVAAYAVLGTQPQEAAAGIQLCASAAAGVGFLLIMCRAIITVRDFRRHRADEKLEKARLEQATESMHYVDMVGQMSTGYIEIVKIAMDYDSDE